MVEINFTDGKDLYFLDIMGPGSVIGVCNIINNEEWTYHAKSITNTEIIEINKK